MSMATMCANNSGFINGGKFSALTVSAADEVTEAKSIRQPVITEKKLSFA
jgi:hypothetical protein